MLIAEQHEQVKSLGSRANFMFGYDELLHKHGCSYSKEPARPSASRVAALQSI
jgi:hypothetical protein